MFSAMRADDIDTLLAIENAVQSHPWTRGNFLDSLNGGHRGFVMREADAVLGFAVIMPLPGEAELLNIAVAPERQGQGLGQALLAHGCASAKGEGAERIFLEVRDSNVRARALYRQYGFAEVGRRRDYYAQGDGRREDAILMAKEL